MRSPADPNQLDSELASITLLRIEAFRTARPCACLAHWGIREAGGIADF